MTDTILANATLVMPTETLRGQVRLSGGRIAEIAEGTGHRGLSGLVDFAARAPA